MQAKRKFCIYGFGIIDVVKKTYHIERRLSMKEKTRVLKDDLPFLRNYEELKPRLSIRLNNPTHITPDTLSQPFLDFLVTCHIDVSDVVGETAYCKVKEGLAEHLGVDRAQLVADAIENSFRTRPPLAMTIEEYMKRLGFPVFEEKNHLMIATTERFFYGAGVILYPGFLESISGGKDLYMIPSSVHEWLYIEDRGDFSKECLTEMLRTVNREVVVEDDFLSDDLYCWRGGAFRRA